MSIEVKKVLTLSKYDLGRHHFDDLGKGEISFWESLNAIGAMLTQLYRNGARLGSKIEVTFRVVETPSPEDELYDVDEIDELYLQASKKRGW